MSTLLFAQSVKAQSELQDSVAETPSKTYTWTRFSTFDPSIYQVQKRYRPLEGDTAFNKAWWRHITFGFSSGIDLVTNWHATTKQIPFNGYIGYRLTPIHQLRLQGGYEEMSVQNSSKSFTTVMAEIQYLANLSSFSLGYNENRPIEYSTIVAAGARMYGDRSTIMPYAYGGLEISARISPNLRFFVQPYVGFTRQTDYLGRNGHLGSAYHNESGNRVHRLFTQRDPSHFQLMYGVHAGLGVGLNDSHDYYMSQSNQYRSWFYEASTGWGFYTGNFNTHLSGSNNWMGFGKWLTRYFGVRAGFGGQQTYWDSRVYSKKEPSNHKLYSNVLIGARGELMVNLLNFSSKFREKDEPTWELDLSAGLQFGTNKKYGLARKSPSMSMAYGFTAAAQALYKVSPGGYIFIEPRYFDSRYSANYVGKDGKGQKTDNLFVLSAGARFYYNRAEERIKNDGYFLPHFWAGLGFGGVKNFDQIHRQQDGYGAFNPSINLNGGYDFNPYATLRLQADWQYFSRFKKDWHTRYQALDLRLLYMLSISNLLRGVDSHNRLHAYLEAGPTWSGIVGQKSTVHSINDLPDTDKPEFKKRQNAVGMNKSTFGGAVGLLLSYDVNSKWDVYTEVLGQANLRGMFHFPSDASRYGLKRIKWGLYTGVRYHLPTGDEDFDRLNLHVKDWQKGWFFESQFGWAKPFGRYSGSNYKFSFGRWLSPLFGVRAGLRYQNNYHTGFTYKDQWTGTPDPSVKQLMPQVTATGHVEAMTDVLNWFPKFREQEDRLFDLNMFAGFTIGRQVTNYEWDRKTDFGGSILSTSDRQHNEMSYTVGVSAGLQGLVKVAPGVQLFVEPSIMSVRDGVFKKNPGRPKFYPKGDSQSNFPITLSVGSRITRPDDARMTRKYGDASNLEGESLNTEFAPNWWYGLQIGGSKSFLCKKFIHDDQSSMSVIQPTLSFNVGRDLTPLSTVRGQLEWSLMNDETDYERTLGNYSMVDARILYMLNFTNLWRGTRYNPRFSFYPEAGVAFSHKSKTKFENTSYNTFGAVLGMMNTFRVNKSIDVTAEAQFQQNFTKLYMNQHENHQYANNKWTFTVGARYHMPTTDDELDRLNLSVSDNKKGWFFESEFGWAKPFGHNGGSNYKFSFGRWLNALFGVRAGLRLQQNYHDSFTYRDQWTYTPDPTVQQYMPQVTATGHVEVITDVLNWFPRLRAEDDRKFNLNLFAGLAAGRQVSNYDWDRETDFGSSILTTDRKHNEMSSTFGVSAGLQALYQVAPGVELFVEPSVMSVRNGVFKKNPLRPSSYSDGNFQSHFPMTVSIGSRITRPDDARLTRKYGDASNLEGEKLNTVFEPHWWYGIQVGGAKSFLCKKFIHDDQKGMSGIQPTLSFNVGRDLTPLSTVRAQLEWSLMNDETDYERTLGNYSMIDARILYMLNFTNLWRGTRYNPRFSVYPEAGLAFSHKSAGKPSSLSNNSMGVVIGVMNALRVSKRVDVTAEAQFQQNFAKQYMNQHVPHRYANNKWTFTVGTRYHMPSSEEEKANMNLQLADSKKGWFFEAQTGWAKPFGHYGGSSYKASFGRWFNSLFGVRAGFKFQQTYHESMDYTDHYTNVTYSDIKQYMPQVTATAHIEVMTDVLNWFRGMRADQDRKFDLNLFAGLALGRQVTNHDWQPGNGFGSSILNKNHSRRKDEMGSFAGLTAGIQALYTVTPGVQLYVEPSILTIADKNTLDIRSLAKASHNAPFTLSVGTRITRSADAKTNKALGNDEIILQEHSAQAFEPHWWAGVELGGAKSFLCLKYIHDDQKGMSGIQPTFSLNAGRDLSPLSTVRFQFEFSSMNDETSVNRTLGNYGMMDLRALYMLNFTNLWKGTRFQPRFSLYPELGIAYSHKSKAISKKYNSKNSFGLVAGMMGALRVSKAMDVTAEAQIQGNTAAKYMNGHHAHAANAKWNFTLGVRYHFKGESNKK